MALPSSPNDRKEVYLSNIAGQGTALPSEPHDRYEAYLDYIAKNGGGGGGTGDGDMKKSVYDGDLAVAGAGGIKSYVTGAISGKVDKVQGKGLSTNDYDDSAKAIVDGVTAALDGKVSKSNTAGLLKNDGTVNTTIEGAVSANTSAITAIKDGTNIDSFGDVETALMGKMKSYALDKNIAVEMDLGGNESLVTQTTSNITQGSGEIPTSGAVYTALQNKVDKVQGKGLSTNDYDNTAKGIVDKAQDNIKANTKLIKDTVGWSGKNLLENLLESHTSNGVTMTHNADGSITLNNTATAWTFQNINYKGADVVSIPTGDYIISGGNSKVTFKIMVNGTSIFAKKVTQDEPFTIPANVTSSYMRIEFDNGTVFNNDTIYPMIRPADILDSTYEPYFGSTAFPRSEQALLGAKNWLNIPKGTYTQFDVTIVVDDTGITLNGTCNAASGTKVNVNNLPISIDAKVADYKGVDVANNMSDDCYIWMSSPFSGGNINGKSWTVSTAAKVTGALSLKGGVTYTNFKIQPMIVLASDSDLSTYAPYAMTNRELTENNAVKELTITPSSGITINTGSYAKIRNGILNAYISLKSESADITAFTELARIDGISGANDELFNLAGVNTTTNSAVACYCPFIKATGRIAIQTRTNVTANQTVNVMITAILE